jgi:hypothetical protein
VDRDLLAALVDRWRLETHTFNLEYGEMTPILQNLLYLPDDPTIEEAEGVVDIHDN